MPLPLLALALAAFGIGTTEFVIMGLLPDVAQDLNVSIPAAGWLVSGYALGVAIGAPIMAVVLARLPRRQSLILLMSIFIAGNAFCALASGYWLLMAARVVTALCHGAFFGIGSLVAASLVPPNRRASAVALMFTGLTLANVLGVPMGTELGHLAGWRSTFWAVTGLGVLALLALIALLPRDETHEATRLGDELRGLLGSPAIWAALLTTVLFSASMFTIFTYIAPILEQITHISPNGVTLTLLGIGVGLTIGNILGGRLADWRLVPALAGTLLALAVVGAVFSVTAQAVIAAEITLFVWGVVSFAPVPALQVNVVHHGGAAPSLVATLNIGAFNVGNALGAWVGGSLIDAGFSLTRLPLAAAVLSVLGAAVVLLQARSGGSSRAAAA